MVCKRAYTQSRMEAKWRAQASVSKARVAMVVVKKKWLLLFSLLMQTKENVINVNIFFFFNKFVRFHRVRVAFRLTLLRDCIKAIHTNKDQSTISRFVFFFPFQMCRIHCFIDINMEDGMGVENFISLFGILKSFAFAWRYDKTRLLSKFWSGWFFGTVRYGMIRFSSVQFGSLAGWLAQCTF